MLVALAGMDRAALRAAPAVQRARGELRAALRYVRADARARIPLAMMALVGTLSFNFQVLLPLLASLTWHGTAATYALLTAAMAVGSVCGRWPRAPAGASRRGSSSAPRPAFGALELLAAAAPSLPLQVLALVPLGAMTVTFSAGVNSTMQLAVDPGDARARDGAVLGRLPRLDADRRAARRAGSPRSPARASGWRSARARRWPRRLWRAVAYARLGERQVATTAVAA